MPDEMDASDMPPTIRLKGAHSQPRKYQYCDYRDVSRPLSLALPPGPATKLHPLLYKTSQADMEDISLIHRAIRSIKGTHFANPDLFTDLPFPSLHPFPGSGRFSSPNAAGRPVKTFSYMGREVFKELQNSIRQPDIQGGSNEFCLYGPSGTGKSHLLAALVCQLVLEGERVFYIPDCYQLISRDAFWRIQTALLFAFHDNVDLCATIIAAPTIAALCQLARTQERRSFYVVIDQINGLEFMDTHDSLLERKKEMTDWLKTFGSAQKVIFSASSASERSSQNAELRQSSIRTFHLQSGMSKVRPALPECLISRCLG